MIFNLKPSGTERLKLNCDDLLSNVAFNFNLRRYNGVMGPYQAGPASLHFIYIKRAGGVTNR
jgi:hypothetical protein